jgi:F plasmid transfer operon, TraF, protein
MRLTPCFSAALAAVLVVVSAAPARAQLYEDVGTRAQGMAGAFVAVADDATAVWWNPAGLASGAIFSLVVEKGRVSEPESPGPSDAARRATTGSFAVSFPSLGLSYYRLRVSQIAAAPSTETLAQNREDVGGEDRRVRTLALSQLGATVGQSLGDHLVVGSTLKLVRGGRASATVGASTEPLDLGDELDLSRETHGDLDVGVMVAYPRVRAGLSVRNVTQPEFGEGSDRLAVKRQARAGLAVLTTSKGAFAALTVAADADLTRTTTPFGDARHVAAGAEAWLVKRRVGFRGGVAANTVGERRPTTSTGVSVAAMSWFYIEAARTFGTDEAIRGWSTAIRLTF